VLERQVAQRPRQGNRQRKMLGAKRTPPAGVTATGQSLNLADIAAAIDKRLFIGKVPPGTSEDEIASVFGVYGVMTECRVMPDRGTGNGIAFVAYESWRAAHGALLETDGVAQLAGHAGTQTTLVVSFAERTGAGRGVGIAYAKGMDIVRVFIGNLPLDATEQELAQRFASVGAVENSEVLPAKVRRRCGFVAFQFWGEAMDAVEKLHGEPLRPGIETEGMTVVLAQPKDRDRRRDGVEHPGEDGSGAARAGAAALAAAAYASEATAKRRRTDDKGASDLVAQLLGAYANAVNGLGPNSACEMIHEQIMKTRQRLGGGSGAPAEAGRGRGTVGGTAPTATAGGGAGDMDKGRIFVGALPHDVTDDDLASLCGMLAFPNLPPESSQLLECRVLPGKGCGYLRYASWEAAEEAFNALQGCQVEGWSQPLRLKWASPRGQGGHQGHPGHQAAPEPIYAAPVPSITPGPGPIDPLAMATVAEVEAQGLDPTRLFVGQISRDIDAGSSLRPIFEAHGPLTEFRWVQEKGVLYASYGSFEEAQSAMQALGGCSVQGISKGLNVKFSQRPRSAGGW